jgi:peptidoglycan hydrolase-like protein with peptidoglycan-binding domain
MQTLKVGSTGPDVQVWQKIVGVKPDGVFGTGTAAATKVWQQKHVLAADGVVGPATWAKATGAPAPVAAPDAAQTVDQWAYNVAKTAAPEMPEAERQYVVAVARGEGRYGKGWTGEGAGSNNWGAVQGTGDAGSFPHIDHHADGSPYTGKFKKYSTPQAGFLDMAHILLKPNVKAALKSGNLHDAVFAQHANGYFELAPEKYLSAVEQNYAQLTANVGWQKMLAAAGVAVGTGALVVGVVLAVAYGAWQLLRTRGA